MNGRIIAIITKRSKIILNITMWFYSKIHDSQTVVFIGAMWVFTIKISLPNPRDCEMKV